MLISDGLRDGISSRLPKDREHSEDEFLIPAKQIRPPSLSRQSVRAPEVPFGSLQVRRRSFGQWIFSGYRAVLSLAAFRAPVATYDSSRQRPIEGSAIGRISTSFS